MHKFTQPGEAERKLQREQWADKVAQSVVSVAAEGLHQMPNVGDARAANLLFMTGYRLALAQLRCGAITRTRAGSLSIEDAAALELAIVKAAKL